MPRRYADLAHWYHLVTPPREYAEEADHVVCLLAAARPGPPPATMLELGCGGGNLASHLDVPELVLTDLSDDMLRVSRRVNPSREHVRGDMRTLRMDRRFDAVLVHDAIDDMLTERDLGAGDRGVLDLEWVHEPTPGATTDDMDFVFLLRGPDGATRVVHDPHVCGLFPQATWDRLIAAAGLVPVDASGVADPWPGEHVPVEVRPA